MFTLYTLLIELYQEYLVSTTTKAPGARYANMNINIYISYVIPVRSKQVVVWYPVDILYFSNICSGTSGTTPLFSFQAVITVTPGAIRGDITSKLSELKTALDASRGGWSA